MSGPLENSRDHRTRDRSAERFERESSEVVHGLRAGLAVFVVRRDEILRVFHSTSVRNEVGELVRWAVSRGLNCEELSDGKLDRIAESDHHEGLCLLTRPRRWCSPNDLAHTLSTAAGGGRAIALDRVRNPYNIGAIVRTAAFFGLDGMLLGAPAPHSGLAPAAVRVAEGGAEHVRVARTTDLAETLARMRARGVRVVGADGRATASAAGFPFGGPVVLALGNEREGLGDRVRAQCDAVVAIRGTGAMESLNVAVAAGLLVAEMVRQARTDDRPRGRRVHKTSL
ncbi:MAG: RNA methyltransferase [Myxococcota bacterium]|nr:RNA methyltransferase [Myxococcota bacterium]